MRRSAPVLVALAAATAAAPAAAQDAAGCWIGRDGEATVLLELERSGGEWDGRIHRLTATAASFPLSSAEVDGTAVRLTFPWRESGEATTLTGQLSGDSLTGSARAASGEARVALARIDPASDAPARELVGYWSGGLEQGGAVVLRLAVEVGGAPCGQVVASLDSPDQGVTDIPIAGMRLAGDSVRFEVPRVGGAFRGTLDPGHTALRGIWTQGPGTLPMSLTRGDSALVWRRPQHPAPPFPYEAAEVTYRNPADGTTLAGTLTLPPGDGPFPAALLLTGSGAQDRDETLMGHKPFLVIADHLTRHGIAVLRVDDRGVGGSSGNVMETTIPDNVADAAAGVEFLRSHPRVDPARVGLIGHSEGGWVAPALAARSDDVAFVVMLAGPATSPYDLLLAQSRAMLEASGEALVGEQVALTGRILDVLRAEPDNQRAIAAMREVGREWLEALPSGDGDSLRARLETPEARAQFEQSLVIQTTPWFRGLLAHDPLPSLEGLQVPVLALFGELDLQVPHIESVPVLERIWADHPDATVRVLPGLNHLFQHAETGLVAEYSRIEETFAPEALELIGEWITQRFAR